MFIDRPELKRQARGIIRASNPKVIYASLIFIVLSALFSYLSSRLTGVSYEQFARYMQYMQEGSVNYARAALDDLRPSTGAELISTVLELAELIVGVGFTVFLFNTVRRTGAVYGNLLDGFGPYFRLVVLRLVMGVFIALWSLLFFFPGIIAAYRYSMAPYVMLDHPDYSIMQCIRESKQMTNGYKGKLFLLDLSFIGWLLLTMIPYLGYAVRVWYQPYHDISYILFYEALRNGTEPQRTWTLPFDM
ncbi:MAG: DUF975 family protein [Oscillospiraceae bacterium]|nr:DUF975 family protein [Oscillospiraceae bacterium]